MLFNQNLPIQLRCKLLDLWIRPKSKGDGISSSQCQVVHAQRSPLVELECRETNRQWPQNGNGNGAGRLGIFE